MELARRRKLAGHASADGTRQMADHLLAEAQSLRRLAQTAEAAILRDALGELAARCDAVASLYLSIRNGRETDLCSSVGKTSEKIN